MHWVKDVKYLEDFKLELTFNNDEVKLVDLSSYVGKGNVFKPLQDIEYFKKVSLDPAGNTICWKNGADFCPNVLYEIGTSK